MPRKPLRNHPNRSKSPLLQFFRRPIVQIGIIALAFLIIVLIALAGSGQPQPTSFTSEININQAYQMYQEKTAFFVDVREQSEWDSFHIPNTILIPLGELPNQLTKIPKDQPIVVVCNSGNRSQQGRDILINAGYKNVTSMAGGVSDWKTQGYPIQP